MATAEELVDARAAAADLALIQANQYLEDLLAVSNVNWADPGFNVDSLLPRRYGYASVPLVSFTVNGAAAPTLSVDSASPVAAPTANLSTLTPVSVPEFLSTDLLSPTNTFEFYETAYSDALLDAAKAALLSNIQNGGYGIETADEAALRDRARDREVEAALLRVDEAGRALAQRGFALPPGELAIAIDRSWQDYQNKVSGIGREIMLERDKLYVENRQFTLREAREMEQILIGFFNSVAERAVNVQKLTVEMAVAVYNAQLARFKQRLDAADIKARVQVAELGLNVEQAKAHFDLFRAQVLAYSENVKRQIETNRLYVDLFRGNVDNARVLNDATVARANLQAELVKATVQQNIQISQVAIENVKTKLLAIVEALKFRGEAAKFGSTQFFANLAAIQSSVNVLAAQTAST